ncbi:hypothetical protein EDB87DRAFT_1679949 [Lactarius vividus]|nr:hypothetical protein EDB87DRAFT_1679949 [Lactarius vividus]
MSEVSTLPSSSYLNHSSATSHPEPSSSATDPAQLLRQAALSSRKLKRRKLDSNPITSLPRPLPRSIVTIPSIALDYGPEEPSSTTSTEGRPPSTTFVPVQPSTPTRSLAHTSPPRRDASSGAAPQTSLSDDLSTREEGEISESEDTPFQLPPVSTTISGVVYHTRAESTGFVQSPFGSRSPSLKTEDTYRHATPPSVSRRLSVEAPPLTLKMQAPLESFRLETPLYVLDTHHVRPGLSLTQRQYDTAKEVILDILGYGVPPEYLIDCGLSREIIYYVFTELNLRLPNNLDIVGIPPYPPPPDVIASILQSQPSYSLPSASLEDSSVVDDAAVRPTLSPQLHDHSPQVPASASHESSLLALSESTLAAMERQRKQELLARKAVQESRKRKEPVPFAAAEPSTSPTTATSTGVDVSAGASAVSVEDFLNSIGPPLTDGANPRQDLTPENESEDMEAYSPGSADGFERNSPPDDDQPMPLVDRTSMPPFSEDASLPISASVSEANFSFEQEKVKTSVLTNKTPQILENLPTRSRSDGMLAPPSTRDDGYDSRRSSSTPQPNAPIPRRGTKRPVAADFDSDPAPKVYTPPVLSRTGSGAGLNYGGGYYPNPHVRHRTNGVAAGGFASLNSTRRCVIDVSDSEDEASEEELSPATSLSRRSQSGAQSTRHDSALALEMEIERMRKMIREREELKLRKQAMASNRSTPVSREETRASEETPEAVASASASATATTDEVPRSETCDNQSSENETSTPRHIKEPAPHWHHSEDGLEQETVDVPASTQVPNDSQAQVKTGSSFTAYNSEMDDTLNLKQLKMQAAARRLSENQLENARICQFEVPGGGECRDADCGDMHLSQLEVEPNDDETARYLCGDQNVAQIVQALQAARARRPEATFNERVKEAWESMRVQASLGIKT